MFGCFECTKCVWVCLDKVLFIYIVLRYLIRGGHIAFGRSLSFKAQIIRNWRNLINKNRTASAAITPHNNNNNSYTPPTHSYTPSTPFKTLSLPARSVSVSLTAVCVCVFVSRRRMSRGFASVVVYRSFIFLIAFFPKRWWLVCMCDMLM